MDELIEVSPIIISPSSEWEFLEKTVLSNYCFHWGENSEDAAIALGYGSLFNHSFTPNATYYNNDRHLTLDFYAIADILTGEEITINYNGEPDDQTPVWFETID